MLGLYTRVSAVVCFLIQLTLADRQAMFVFGGDSVFNCFLFLVVLAPCGAAWSLDARWRGKGRGDVPCWPRRLILFQLAVIYTTTGLYKIGSSWSFWGGWSALYLALNLPGIARWPGDWAAWVYPLTQLATFVAGWFETLFFLVPINLYLRWHRDEETCKRRGRIRRLLARWDLRWPFLALGLVMHISLTIFLDLGLFSITMLSLYPCLLYPSESKRVLEWAARLPGRLLRRS
jgi:hypothetical protein